MSNIISSRFASMMRSVLVSNSPYSCFLVRVLVFANASNSRLSSSASFVDESNFDETCGMHILYDISYNTTTAGKQLFWCSGRESNPQTFRREILSLLSLPISPPEQCCYYNAFCQKTTYLSHCVSLLLCALRMIGFVRRRSSSTNYRRRLQ